MDVYLLAGQSNMAGGVIVEELPESVNTWPDHITCYGPEGIYSVLENEKAGPEVGFATQLPPEPVLIIKYAKGGTNLANDWSHNGERRSPADEHHGEPGCCWELFNKAIEAAEAAYEQLTFKAFVWMQGERDSTDIGMANDYGKHIKELINAVRERVATPNLPAIIGRVTPRVMNAEGYHAPHSHRNIVRAAQVAFAEEDDHATWIDADDLPQRPDNLHFITPGSLCFGRRLADAALKFHKK